MLIDDQFCLRYLIGEGGMGTVWAAEDLRLGRMVAVKFLSRHLLHDTQARLRFEREARLIARIRSPHVVQVFAQGCTEDGTPYLIMELLEGEDLSARIAQIGRCSLAETGNIVAQVCRGLGRAHAEGLVHRDVKPHNIFLTNVGNVVPTVKLLDFGIAKEVRAPRDSLTACGEVIGSALYTSPEQLRDPQAVGPASDVWSLGIVIYEALTGRVPFEVGSLSELIERHRDARFPPASSLVSSLPHELDAFLDRAIDVTVESRWQSVEELAHAFDAIVRRHCPGSYARADPATFASRARTEHAPEPGSGSAFGKTTERSNSPPLATKSPGRGAAVALVLLALSAMLAWRQAARRSPAVRVEQARLARELSTQSVRSAQTTAGQPEALEAAALQAEQARVPTATFSHDAAQEPEVTPANSPTGAALRAPPSQRAPSRRSPHPPGYARPTTSPAASEPPAPRTDEPAPRQLQPDQQGRNHGF